MAVDLKKVRSKKFKPGDKVMVAGSFGEGYIIAIGKGLYNHYFYDIQSTKGNKRVFAVAETALKKIR